jgi:hypothetical protein
MLLRRKILNNTIGKHRYKAILKSAKFAKKIDKIYNNITNPITLAEIAQNHFPYVCSYISHSIIMSFLTTNHISTSYETLSFLKDISEGTSNIIKDFTQFNNNTIIENMIKGIRLFLLVHRLHGHIYGFDHIFDNLDTSFCLDYITFAIGYVISSPKH